MSKFSNLIDQLDKIDRQDIKNTSRLLGVTATLYERLQKIVNREEAKNLPAERSINKEVLMEKFGNYRNAYHAYNKTYGITAKGWDSLLLKVQNLPIPVSLENRVEELESKLEKLVDIISELLIKNE